LSVVVVIIVIISFEERERGRQTERYINVHKYMFSRVEK